MIDLAAYWMGRDKKFPDQCTDEIRANAEETVDKVNMLLKIYQDDADLVLNAVSSGWRPKSVNESTANSGAHSNHIQALACDVRDLTGQFPRWCANNLDKLTQCQLWMEDWHYTPTWAHLQIIAPHSGKRMYFPFDPNETKPPISLTEKP